jgi:putative PIN family toxin of toxin-antitoxin system
VRIVLDTSVLVAAHIARAGVCAELVEMILEDPRHSIHASEFILQEFNRTLIHKLDFDPRLSNQALDRWKSCVSLVIPIAVAPQRCRDPQDLAILGTAAAAKAELLISVDKDLLTLGSFHQTRIVKPGEAFALIRGS